MIRWLDIVVAVALAIGLIAVLARALSAWMVPDAAWLVAAAAVGAVAAVVYAVGELALRRQERRRRG